MSLQLGLTNIASGTAKNAEYLCIAFRIYFQYDTIILRNAAENRNKGLVPETKKGDLQ